MMQAQGSNLYRHFVAATATRDGRFTAANNPIEILSKYFLRKRVMVEDTTTLSYWLNWRFLLCGLWVLVAMVFQALLIWRYEEHREIGDESSGVQQEAGSLYDDEVWGTCSKSIHPIWLLAYRIVAFCTLLVVLLPDFVINGAGKKFSFTLSGRLLWSPFILGYFMQFGWIFWLASSFSILGYLRYRHEVEPESTVDNADLGSYTALETGSSDCYGETNFITIASVWGYTLQIAFQMAAGAVALTDSVFWLILYPSNYSKHLSFLIVCKHSVNGLLLGDTILNRLRFPFFRIAYFDLFYGHAHSSFSSGLFMLVYL